jgi:hypothetical protein
MHLTAFPKSTHNLYVFRLNILKMSEWMKRLIQKKNGEQVIKYIEMRISDLEDELAKNPSEENKLIINHGIGELRMVLQMLRKHV